MNDIKQIRWEVWVDDNQDRKMQRNVCAFHVDREGEITDGSLRSIWFVLEESELQGLSKGTVQSLVDGYHKLEVSWPGSVIFFDMEIPRDDAGVMKIPYLRMNLPKRFWEYLYRIAKFSWAQLRKADQENKNERYYYSGRRIELIITKEVLARFTSRYGQGLGKIDKQYSERLISELQTRPEKLPQDNPSYTRRSLKDCIKQIEQIALNSTRSVYQTARCRISNDMDGYFFQVPFMHGGIVQHGREPNSDDWSIHT
jgi:hypothetical protein